MAGQVVPLLVLVLLAVVGLACAESQPKELTVREVQQVLGFDSAVTTNPRRSLFESSASMRCKSRKVPGIDFSIVTRYLQHSDSGSAKNCCRVCLKERSKKFQREIGVGPCIGWIANTKSKIFNGSPVCLTLFEKFPGRAFNHKKVDARNPKGSAFTYSYGQYSSGCTCPAYRP